MQSEARRGPGGPGDGWVIDTAPPSLVRVPVPAGPHVKCVSLTFENVKRAGAVESCLLQRECVGKS